MTLSVTSLTLTTFTVRTRFLPERSLRITLSEPSGYRPLGRALIFNREALTHLLLVQPSVVITNESRKRSGLSKNIRSIRRSVADQSSSCPVFSDTLAITLSLCSDTVPALAGRLESRNESSTKSGILLNNIITLGSLYCHGLSWRRRIIGVENWGL